MSEISELMARDPLSLTKEDRREIINYYRENRVKFLAGNRKAGAPAKPEKGPKPAVTKLTFDDLGL